MISQILVYWTFTQLQPTLALHLESYGYSGAFIGFSFAIPTLIYASTSPLIYILTERLRKSAVIMFGYSIASLAMFIVGTSSLFLIPNNPEAVVLGLAFLGFGCGMINIPVLPDMIESVEQVYPALNDSELNNHISGLFIACQGIGETIGPIFGSTAANLYGFRHTQEIIAFTLMTYMILYFLFCGGTQIFALNKIESNDLRLIVE